MIEEVIDPALAFLNSDPAEDEDEEGCLPETLQTGDALRAGSSRSDRMVVYMNRVDRICFNLTQPLRRMNEEYGDMRIKIPYIAQFSEVRFLYPTTVRYLDGI